MKTIIIDMVERFDINQLQQLKNIGDIIFTPLTANALQDLPKNAYTEDVIIAPNPDEFRWELTANDLQQFTSIKAICLPTTAFEWVDLSYCKKNNITVTNVPNYSTEAVAEYAIWMMFSVEPYGCRFTLPVAPCHI